MIYTCKENESFDAEILRQELVASIGADGWHLNTAGNQVFFIPDSSLVAPYTGSNDVEGVEEKALWNSVNQTIQLHFTNGPKREHNKAILKQITDLEATQTPRRIREGGQWLVDLEAQIQVLRGQLL